MMLTTLADEYDDDYNDDHNDNVDDNYHNLAPAPLNHWLGIFCPSNTVAHNVPDDCYDYH